MKEENRFVVPKEEQSWPTVVLSDKDEAILEDKVRAGLKEDIIALAKIKPLLKTEHTFSNSIGEILDFIEDRKKCACCPGRINACLNLKRGRNGYHLVPFYDKDLDRIRLRDMPCKYLTEIEQVLSRIEPCDCTTKVLYYRASSLLESLKRGDNLEKQQGIAHIFLSAMKHASDNKISTKKGFAFSTPNGGTQLAYSLLALIGYTYASKGKTVGYLKTKEFFTNLFSRNPDVASVTFAEFKSLFLKDVILLEDIDGMPFLDDNKVQKFLLPLLKSREKEGTILYCSFSGMHLNSFVYRNRQIVAMKNSLLTSLDGLLEERTVQDLDLR